MPYYNYKCENCGEEELRHIMQEGKKWEEEIIVKQLSKEEADALPDWDDPRDYIKTKTITYKNLPEIVKCNLCKGKAKFQVPKTTGVKFSGNSYHATKELKRFVRDGLDKEQSEQFYKDAIQGSKDRMKTGSQHYKKVDFDYKVLEEKGLVKRRTDTEAYAKLETQSKLNKDLFDKFKLDPKKNK